MASAIKYLFSPVALLFRVIVWPFSLIIRGFCLTMTAILYVLLVFIFAVVYFILLWSILWGLGSGAIAWWNGQPFVAHCVIGYSNVLLFFQPAKWTETLGLQPICYWGSVVGLSLALIPIFLLLDLRKPKEKRSFYMFRNDLKHWSFFATYLVGGFVCSVLVTSIASLVGAGVVSFLDTGSFWAGFFITARTVFLEYLPLRPLWERHPTQGFYWFWAITVLLPILYVLAASGAFASPPGPPLPDLDEQTARRMTTQALRDMNHQHRLTGDPIFDTSFKHRDE